jgi:hypothetical protein
MTVALTEIKLVRNKKTFMPNAIIRLIFQQIIFNEAYQPVIHETFRKKTKYCSMQNLRLHK